MLPRPLIAADTWSKSMPAKTLHEQELNNTKNTRASTESDAPALASY